MVTLQHTNVPSQEELDLELEIGQLLFHLGNVLNRPYFEVQCELQRLDRLYRRLMQLRAARQ